MANFDKPDNVNNVWASAGDKIYAGDVKTATGWEVEIPPRQIFNQIDYKQDQFIAHVNQHGIAVWDAETEYQSGKSYVQDSTGAVRRALITHTNQNPTTTTGYWETAFVSFTDASAVKKIQGYEIRSSDFAATVNTRVYCLAPLILTLPSVASQGDVVTVSKSPNITVNVYSASPLIKTKLGLFDTAIYDWADEINFTYAGSNWEV